YVTGQTYATSHPISNTNLDVLYQTERWAPNLRYQFDVPNGSYQVTLHFAEIYYSRIGGRIFDANLEENLVLDNYDVYRDVGHDVATAKSFQVTVRDGRLDIELTASVDAGKLSALEVTSVSSTPVLAVTPTSLDFGTSQTRLNLTLTNTGDGDLNWSVAENPAVSWITGLNPGSGILAGGVSATVVIEATREGLTAGSYTGNLQVISNGGNLDVSVTLSVASTQNYVQRVNCGSTTPYTDPAGLPWEADRAYSSGSWGYSTGNTYATTHPIGNTNQDVLYQTERWAPDLRYRFDVPNGNYQVNLHFAEIYYSRVGARIFDINLEGNLVLDNYDLYREVGHDVATTKSFQVTVSDGHLDIELTASVDAGKLSALEVASVTSTPTPLLAVTPASLDFGTSQTRLNLTLTNTGGGDLSWSVAQNPAVSWITGLNPTSGNLAGGAMATVAVDVSRESLAAGSYTGNLQVISNGGNRDISVVLSVGSTPNYVQRINCGSTTAYTDGSGLVWDKDQEYTIGNWGYSGGATYSVYDPITNTMDYKLFQSERWGSMSYLFDVSNGQYQVTLYFAEIYFTQSAKRVFDVEIEGQSVLNRYDIFAEVGHDVATQKQFTVTVADNQLNLDFIAAIEDPKISAIQVRRITNTNTYQFLTEHPSDVTPAAQPAQFVLHQNYPNPFNLETQIRYELAAPAQVHLAIYNSLGQLHKILQSGEYQAGIYETNWNGRDANDFPVASGMYLLKMTITPLNAELAPFVQTRRLLLAK
ncbi:T9SS type A sorting domain-containing protein, partial [candidate division KSB1 bacterium]|nr:T9SS type A sorting domain-containing protein [candidate division KSB1 bacterium]